MQEGYFNIKRDNLLIANGTHFWCSTCLVARPKDEQSPDERYDQNCHDFLLKEAEMITDRRRPEWIPREPTKPQISPQNQCLIVGGMEQQKTKMSTSNENTARVDKFKVSVRSNTYKKKELPEGLIEQLHGGGLGSKAIATKLKGQGINVSYKTVQRVLAGAR